MPWNNNNGGGSGGGGWQGGGGNNRGPWVMAVVVETSHRILTS